MLSSLIHGDLLPGAFATECNSEISTILAKCRSNIQNVVVIRNVVVVLDSVQLVEADIRDAVLKDCYVYGISAWSVKGKPKDQSNLIITAPYITIKSEAKDDIDNVESFEEIPEQPTITVDNLEVAQFVYLLINNEKIRDVVQTITTKIVLILGRFTPDRKAVLDAIKGELQKHNYLPILFDFDQPIVDKEI